MLNRNGTELSNEQLKRWAPSIFADAPRAGLSERYTLIPTVGIVDALRGAGWRPVYAGQSRVRSADRVGVQRHVIRFRHADAAARLGEIVPELVMVNSHDGSSAYQLHAGIFRLVCSNGLIVADSTFERLSIRHSGRAADEVVEASFRVVEEIPRIVGAIEGMRAVDLSERERTIFAESAARLRWDAESTPIEPAALLAPRRSDDRAGNLWTTFNAVQENLVRGGIRGRDAQGRRRRTRGVNSVDADTKLNKALWHLADSMRQIKEAA